MSYLPTVRDSNGHPLTGCGTEVLTYRYAAVDTDGQAISLPLDIKELLIHIEGTMEVARVTGTATGSTQARITSDGVTLEDIAVATKGESTVLTIAAPSGTIDVSVIARR